MPMIIHLSDYQTWALGGLGGVRTPPRRFCNFEVRDLGGVQKKRAITKGKFTLDRMRFFDIGDLFFLVARRPEKFFLH